MNNPDTSDTNTTQPATPNSATQNATTASATKAEPEALSQQSADEKPPLFQRVSNTFMRRRTHMSQNAEVGLSDTCAYLFASDDVTDLRALFSNTTTDSKTETRADTDTDTSQNPLTLEIGFGMGSSLIEMAQAAPETNFVGIEVHEPGLGLCAYNAHKHQLKNIRLINGDAIAILGQLPDDHIDTVQLYFPDPWQKKRHFKRRFVSHTRMPLVTQKLCNGGIFHTATDWEHYAFWMLDVLDNTEQLKNLSGTGNFHPRPDFRPLTKFEKRGIARGHGVWDLMYQKTS